MTHDQVTGFPDCFFGPADKSYLDTIARDVTRVRGVDVYYYVLKDQTRRTDGDTPVSDKPGLGPFDTRAHSGNVALYGEPVTVKNRLSAVKREIQPSWDYAEPVLIRGIAMEPSSDEQADERGTLYNRRLVFHLARIIAEDSTIRPRQGDVIQLTSLLDGYFDVEDVSRDDSRFGATGFFTNYRLELSQSSKFKPDRKVLPTPPTTEPPEDV